MSEKDPGEYTLADWQALAASVRKRADLRLFIDGAFVDAIDGGRMACVSPVDGETQAEFALGNEKDIDRAVAAAKAAFRSGVWSKLAPRERMEILYRFADLVEQNRAELAVLDTLDMGKPVSDSLDIDMAAVVETIRFMAECIDKIEGAVTSTASDVLHLVLREPLGVVGAISPWNYPQLMAIWKVAPALAAGNTVVLKPAEEAPSGCLRLAELFVEAGGPLGVFNVVNGVGEIAGRALALHPDVQKISFTGSTAVGKLMLQYAGQSNMKRVGLECGGKSPQIFAADLPDMEAAVSAAINGIYGNMGEVCNAGSRLLVDKRIRDEFLDTFVRLSRGCYEPGDPLNPETTLGPLVTHQAQQRVLGMIGEARSAGARLVFGGEAPAAFSRGAYVEPTLFADVDNSMRIARDEIFGPVASLIAFDDIDHAVEIANDTIYGLAAGVWTRDLDTAHRLVREVEAGVIWINTFDAGDMTQPFGGYKQSGNARDKCMESLLEYTQMKSAWFQLGGGA